MILRMSKCNVDLPSFETVEERMKLAEEIVEKYPLEFELSGFEKADSKVFVKLDILGTYILKADKENQKDIMTQYKIKARKIQEPVVSNLPEGLQWHIENKMFSNN